NQLTRPITMQIPAGPGMKISRPGALLQFSLDVPAYTAEFQNDWIGASDANAAADRTEASQAQQQFCAVQPGPITFDLPSNSQVFVPCDSFEECQETTRRVYVTQIENSRTPVRLPAGHFSSTMVQLSPYGSFFSPGGTLTMPNRDCLPSG